MEVALVALLEQIAVALGNAYLEYEIRQAVDEFGNLVTQFYQAFDNDGDGIAETENVLFSLISAVPDLDNDYILVNDGDEVGLGLPEIRIIDGMDIGAFVDIEDNIIGNSDGYLVDLDGDMDCDDVLVPLKDLTGDGMDDWGWILDVDENGLPDLAEDSPFYPVGSEQYYDIISASSNDSNIMEKPLDNYSVTEGLLLLLLLCNVFYFIKSIFKRKDVFR